jgi:hypothetical protein
MSTQTEIVTPKATQPTNDLHYVDWAGVIGGLLVASALTMILMAFGAALGLSMTSAEPREGVSATWLAIASGIWVIWVCITSFAAGGYFAGRARRRVNDANHDEVETRDGGNGLLVWAGGVVLGSVLAATGVANTVSAIGGGAGVIVDQATDLAGAGIEATVDRTAAMALSQNGTVASPELREELGSILGMVIVRGEVDAETRAYAEAVIAQNTELSQEEASQRIDAAIARVESVQAELRQTAVEAAETARRTALVIAFVLAATLLVSAAAAWFAAIAGGKHRDDNIPFAKAYWR